MANPSSPAEQSPPASITELVAEIDALSREVAELRSIVVARDGRIADLEALLSESRRAGKRQAAPFSKAKPKEDPARPGRKSGKAHGRHGRRMVPTHWDHELDAGLPDACPGCGGELEETEVTEQFQTEMPEPRPATTRFVVHVGRCRDCGKRVQGRHPDQSSDALGAAGSQVGPRAKALATWLHYGLGLSFGRCSEVLGRLGIPVSRGALCQASATTSTDLVPTHQAIKDTVAASEVLTMDETGWRIGGYGAWLWAAATEDATLYDVAEGRGFDAATNLVPADYDGVIVRDGWAVYRCYDKATHQTCLAHLLRRCKEMECDLADWARGTPRQVKDLLVESLEARELPEVERAEAAFDLAERIELLIAGAHPHDENRKLVAHLEREQDALFTFLTQPGVDATNWRGETAIRPAVVNRKVWGGNRTERGATTQGRIMSFLRTATQQGGDAIEMLVELARAPNPGVVGGLRLVTAGASS
ncbi:MAG: IS66 family transposase [Candidatus Dormibacteraceae bacterium]